MAYGNKFILGFENELNEFYEIYFDVLDWLGGSLRIFGAEDCMTLRSTTGDENKLEPILGTECLINIVVGKLSIDGIEWDNDTLQIDDLIAQHDNDIRVTVYKEQDYSKSVFQGFIVVEDNNQPFLDPPFTLSVRALDGLGLLKGVDMIDDNGAPFAGVLSVEDWLGNILYKTSQTLNLRVYFPFYPAGASEAAPPLQQVFLNAQLFQQGEITPTTDPTVDIFASATVDAYTALEYICKSFVARIFQADGVWNFVSLYSHADPNGMFYNESTMVLTAGIINMTPVAVGNGLNYDVPVGDNMVLHPVEDDAVRYLKLANKWVKLNYNYDQSVNKVCNQSFKEGLPNPTFDGTISSTIEDDTIVPTVVFTTKGYDNFCWPGFGGTAFGGGTNPFPETAQTADIYIREVQDIYNAPENRYLVINNAPTNNHVRSTNFLVDVNDILQVSFDYRTRDNIAPIESIIAAHILLDGDDGTHWGLGSLGLVEDNRWFLLDANYMIGGGTNNPPLIVHPYTVDEPTTNWTNYSVDRQLSGLLNKVPVSGTAFIILVGGPTGYGTENWFKNLQVKILPYLQGSYSQLKGDYNYSASSNTFKQTMSEDVNISDSPKRYFKGALVQANNDLIPPTWHRRGVIESFRFAQLMERIIYNNVFKINEKIEGTMRGTVWTSEDFADHPIGFLNRFHFTDHPTPTKQFIQTSFEVDYASGRGRRVFVEFLTDVNDTGFTLPDDYVFQYIYA